MRDKDTFALREMFQYFSLAEKPFDHWEIITLWRAFQIIDKSRHGLVKMTYSEDNWWCSWVEQRGDLRGQNVYMERGELSVNGSIDSLSSEFRVYLLHELAFSSFSFVVSSVLFKWYLPLLLFDPVSRSQLESTFRTHSWGVVLNLIVSLGPVLGIYIYFTI